MTIHRLLTDLLIYGLSGSKQDLDLDLNSHQQNRWEAPGSLHCDNVLMYQAAEAPLESMWTLFKISVKVISIIWPFKAKKNYSYVCYFFHLNSVLNQKGGSPLWDAVELLVLDLLRLKKLLNRPHFILSISVDLPTPVDPITFNLMQDNAFVAGNNCWMKFSRRSWK